ncbi:MAG: VWA domain-containing protein [Chloroflexi bacterium]|nr:VWA domain-containing protein [Chloroflexota bacterium]
MMDVPASGRLPAVEVSGPALLWSVLGFGRELKQEGLTADLAAVLDYVRALDLVDIGDREEVRAAGAALFVRRRDEIEPYERAFARFWRGRGLMPAPMPELATEVDETGEAPPRPSPEALPDDAAVVAAGVVRDTSAIEQGEEAEEEPTPSETAWSAGERLRGRAFDRMTPHELREAERLIDRMVLRMPRRRTRRWKLHRQGTLLAPRQMMRRNLATGGDPVTWLWRRRVQRPRGVLLLCDISGSMERHARLLLRFCHALARTEVPTEAFCFGTRLTRITPQLRTRDPDEALLRISDAVGDWSGGTRIGGAFREFNQRWSRRTLRSSAIVLVVSDGWDRGDPAEVAVETARLRRSCHRLIWLNPLAGATGYRPLAAGMAAAWPHIDVFLPSHDLASLELLARALEDDAGARTGVTLR